MKRYYTADGEIAEEKAKEIERKNHERFLRGEYEDLQEIRFIFVTEGREEQKQ